MEEYVNIKFSGIVEKEVLTVIVDRVPKGDTEYVLPPRNPDNIERPYSLIPGDFYEDEAIITYPGVKKDQYSINTRGEIYNLKTRKKLEGTNLDRYCRVDLRTDFGKKPFYRHRLVAYQFCNPPYNFESLVVNHIDGNTLNPYANNLEWITIAANNQHGIERHRAGGNTFVLNNRPIVNEEFVHHLCREFVKGKTNQQIMKDLGLIPNPANHCLLKDIRRGETWKEITSLYQFRRDSRASWYTEEEQETIKMYMHKGKNHREIFSIMNDTEYLASRDQLNPKYKILYSIFNTYSKERSQGLWDNISKL